MPKGGVLALLLAISLCACSSLGYYSQAVVGHVEVMRASRPISEVIEDATTDPTTKKKLEEVRRLRDFASRELGLPENDSYRSYADIQRPFVTWNVFAANEFSLQPETWCMLVVGCVGYRGFYSRSEAESLAGELRQEGFDTYVAGISAYSTLGYFNDPVLNTFLKSDSVEVARLIFHELAHQVLYVEGDTVFNESFATAVENEGLRRWFAQQGTPERARAVGERHKQKAEFVELMKGFRRKLQEIYLSDLSVDAKRRGKAEAIATIKRTYLVEQKARGNPPVFKEWLEHGLNNAKLASLGLYTQLLPAFETLLELEDHDLPRFYLRVAELGALPDAERAEALEELMAFKAPVAVRAP